MHTYIHTYIQHYTHTHQAYTLDIRNNLSIIKKIHVSVVNLISTVQILEVVRAWLSSYTAKYLVVYTA